MTWQVNPIRYLRRSFGSSTIFFSTRISNFPWHLGDQQLSARNCGKAMLRHGEYLDHYSPNQYMWRHGSPVCTLQCTMRLDMKDQMCDLRRRHSQTSLQILWERSGGNGVFPPALPSVLNLWVSALLSTHKSDPTLICLVLSTDTKRLYNTIAIFKQHSERQACSLQLLWGKSSTSGISPIICIYGP